MSGAGGGQSGPLPGMPGAPAAPASAPVRNYKPPAYPQPTTMTGGGGFWVDVERVPHAIADLRNAAAALRDEAEKALELTRMKPPGLDRVSENAVNVFVDAAVGQYGSVRQALWAAAARFESDAAKLEDSLKEYLHVDTISMPNPRALKLEKLKE